MSHSVAPLLEKASAARAGLIDERRESALRLFNGFTEGFPGLTVDVYGATLLIQIHTKDIDQTDILPGEIETFFREKFPWLCAGILKSRGSASQEERWGRLLFGDKPDGRIREHGIWHAIDLRMNRDASFYLDTRNVRKWLMEHATGWSILNAFAYTGSLGTAALAGGAGRAVQLDRNRRFLDLARISYKLNGFHVNERDLIAADFFTQVGHFKKSGTLFDCVIIDPPFFSVTPAGRVDQVNESARLINKVRPLIQDGGHLIAINNALYVSGEEYIRTLETLCKDGYMNINELLPVPDDFTGFPATLAGDPITDPAPFNHSTKIAVLGIRRK